MYIYTNVSVRNISLVIKAGLCHIHIKARFERETCTLHSRFSVTDGMKINELNKSIGIGPLYLQTEIEAI